MCNLEQSKPEKKLHVYQHESRKINYDLFTQQNAQAMKMDNLTLKPPTSITLTNICKARPEHTIYINIYKHISLHLYKIFKKAKLNYSVKNF